jgi:hypothetical protein
MQTPKPRDAEAELLARCYRLILSWGEKETARDGGILAEDPSRAASATHAQKQAHEQAKDKAKC